MNKVMILIVDSWIFQISKDDGLPKNICQRCLYKLDMFYEFRLSCMTTDTVLKNYADSLKQLSGNQQVIYASKLPNRPVIFYYCLRFFYVLFYSLKYLFTCKFFFKIKKRKMFLDKLNSSKILKILTIKKLVILEHL